MTTHHPREESALTATHRAGVETDFSRAGADFQPFFQGETGAAHVLAHRMLDESRYDEGHRRLRAWLNGRSGWGDEWVHIQWHMAVFELGVGHWNGALTRFKQHILPAVASEHALTDAPSVLWRLALAEPEAVDLPWEPVRQVAVARMQKPDSPFIVLHNLLALAGGHDLVNLDRWLRQQSGMPNSRAEVLLRRIAIALRLYVEHCYRQAAEIFEAVVPHVAEVGGSRAQNELFQHLAQSSRRLASANSTRFGALKAA